MTYTGLHNRYIFLFAKKISVIDDKLTSSKLKNSSSGREQTPTEEDKQSSKSHQGKSSKRSSSFCF